MKLLFDFFPIILFFIVFKTNGIFAATAAAIIATFVQVGLFWFKHRRFEKMHLVTLALISVFGGATLLLEDELYIKWKPTVLNWLFAVVFIGSQFIGKKTIAERMMGNAIKLPDPIWTRLNWSWALFFVVLGFANIFVFYNYDTETWVNFKLFGMLGLTVLFVVAQSLVLARFIKQAPS